MSQYLVIGNPIAHSISPKLHTAFAKQTQQILSYDKLCVEPENFFQTLDTFFSSGGKGANITAPFKSMAFEYTQHNCSEAAKLSKAVNTLYLNPKDNIVWGDNTDGLGLLRDLEKRGWTIARKKILILGTGGAVRGILPSLLSEKPASITLYNRSLAKANVLIHEFQSLGQLSSIISETETYDIVFNAIPSSQVEQSEFWSWLPSHIASQTHAYDLSYVQDQSMDTPFVLKIKKLGCLHAVDGLGMLVEQAAESFFIWRGVKPSTHIFHMDNRIN